MRWHKQPPALVEPLSENASEREIVLRAQQDPAAFEVIFDRYRDAIRRFCYLRLGSWEEADDAAQLTMIDIASKIRTFSFQRDDSDFRRWIFTIAHAKRIDVFRKVSLRRSEPVDQHPGLAIQADTENRELTLDWLRRLFESLTDDQRRVMELRAAEFTTPEIASMLELSEDNVRKIVQRARDRMLEAESTARGGRDV